MRPRLHTDTLYMLVADGVSLRNNRSHLTIRGKTIYRWLENLVPYFNGQHELEEITDGLDTSRKTMVNGLVETLFKHHFLSDASLDQPHGLSNEELAIYAPEIAFIESFQSSAAQRFETFRQTRVLIVGNGLAFSACVRACLQSGIKHLSIIRTTEDPALNVFSPIDEAELFLPRDTSQQMQELSPPDWNETIQILAALQPFQTIFHLSDRPMLKRVRLLNALCVEQQKLFLQVCFVRDQAWVGPLVSLETQGCWECAWRRLQSNIQDAEQLPLYALEDQDTTAPGRWFAFPAAAIAANQLVFELFTSVTQVGPPEDRGQLISLDLETLVWKGNSFLPHLLCQSCQHPSATTANSFLEQIEQLERLMPLDRAAFARQAAQCFDDRIGIFRAIDEESFEQVPLAVCKIEISNPALRQDRSQMRSVVETGLDFQDARRRSIQKACEVYAARALDPRRLVTRVPVPDLVVPLESFLTTTQSSIVDSWSWAWNLQAREPYLVPVSLAFPALYSEESTGFVGSGMNWPEALCQALFDWACYLTIAQLNDRQRPYARIDLHAVAWTPEGEYLLFLLTAAGALPEIYDVTGPLDVPTFAICMQEQATVYVSHCDAMQALISGLELTLRHFQSHDAQQPAYDVEAGPLLSPALRSDEYVALPELSGSPEWSASLAWMQQKFQEQGWHALAIPLNHDPALAKVLPFLARVLLVRAERER